MVNPRRIIGVTTAAIMTIIAGACAIGSPAGRPDSNTHPHFGGMYLKWLGPDGNAVVDVLPSLTLSQSHHPQPALLRDPQFSPLVAGGGGRGCLG